VVKIATFAKLQTVLCKLKTQRSNSTFGFLPTHEPTLRKTKRAVSCQLSMKKMYHFPTQKYIVVS